MNKTWSPLIKSIKRLPSFRKVSSSKKNRKKSKILFVQYQVLLSKTLKKIFLCFLQFILQHPMTYETIHNIFLFLFDFSICNYIRIFYPMQFLFHKQRPISQTWKFLSLFRFHDSALFYGSCSYYSFSFFYSVSSFPPCLLQLP